MKITVGSTELTVTSAYAYRYQNGKLVLKLVVPQTEIEHDELKALLKNNTDDIIKTDDNNQTETFSGFSYTLTILDKDDIYEVEVECISETERKVLNLQNLVAAQNQVISEQNNTIESQADDLMLANATIDDILTSIIPEMMGLNEEESEESEEQEVTE